MINKKWFKKVGIVSVGGYIPEGRIEVGKLAEAWGKEGEKIEESLGVKAKAVAGKDEDAVSLGVTAGEIALERAGKIGVKPEVIGAVLVGSESHPYAVKATAGIVAHWLGIEGNFLAGDLEFACKAGTTALMLVASMIEAGVIEAGIAIGADVAQAKPGDALMYTAGAGAGAVVLGSKRWPWLAEVKAVDSFTTETTDFWRRSGQKYPSHGGRFTGEPGYFRHVITETRQFLKKQELKIEDFWRVILHSPNGKFPHLAAKNLGISKDQLEAGLLVSQIGNSYAANSMLGLVKVMEEFGKGKVLVVSYGSGAGSDGLMLEKQKIEKIADAMVLSKQLEKFNKLNYSEYLKLEEGR